MSVSCALNSLVVCGADLNMAKSNLNGRVGPGLEGRPLPEKATEPMVDEYLKTTAQYFASGGDPDSVTPVPSGSVSVSRHWSDSTLTGTLSGRCSSYSWGADEAELDRATTETVRRLFDKINGALYEGWSTGSPYVDQECQEWSSTFPHLKIQGIHLLDTMDDGTEMVAPDPFLPSFSPQQQGVDTSSGGLAIVGQQLTPLPLENVPEHEHLQEEIIAADGVSEEYFAFDNTDEGPAEGRRKSRLRGSHGLPPVTPNACVRDAVCSEVFDQIWNEVITVLQPLLARIRERGIQGHTSSYSVGGQLTPTGSPPLGIGPLQHQPYILRGLRDQPTLTKAAGHAGSQLLRFKYSSPTALPQLTNLSGLKDVMQIRSLPLQQRVPSSYVPTVIAFGDTIPSRNGSPTQYTVGRAESSAVGSRLTRMTTPLLPRTSENPLPTTPAKRLLSSRHTNRRNLATLKPIEKPKTPKPKTPALVPIDDGIRGYSLSTNLHSSPPSTPYVRHTQLPPLETPVASQFERSPPLIRSGAQKNRVTFSSKIVNASESQDPWKFPRPTASGGGELRPHTTSTFSRSDVSKPLGRKISDYSLPVGRMKIVGHAAGIHGNDLFLRERATIIEDDEFLEEEEDEIPITITGTSGFFQAKSKSGRTKLRSHIR